MADFVFNPTYAEHCAIARPGWTPEDGKASSIVEFLILLATPLGIAWLALLLLLFWARNGFLGVLFSIACTAQAAHWVVRYSLDDDLYLGTVGGCVGSLTATLVVLALGFLFGLAIAALDLRDRFGSRTRM